MEVEKGDLCFLKSLRKVSEVNSHKGKDQLIAGLAGDRLSAGGVRDLIYIYI